MNVSSKLAMVLVAGWLAEALASTDPDVDAGLAAYEAEDFEGALSHFDVAKGRLGERPEIAFDRGLTMLRLDKRDEARTAFERATEAEDDDLRASAYYELGNLELDAEAYDLAIERYIDALKANPLHANAKWNLELALLKKKEQEEEEQQEDEEENEDQEGEENEDQENEENQDEEQEGEDNEEQEGEENQDEEQEGEENQDEQEGEENQDEQQDGDPPEPEQPEGEPEQEDQPEQDQPQPENEEQPPAEPKPVDRMDMKRALEKLDEQDPFTLDRAQGGYVQPEKDW